MRWNQVGPSLFLLFLTPFLLLRQPRHCLCVTKSFLSLSSLPTARAPPDVGDVDCTRKLTLFTLSSLAYAELYLTLAHVLSRFEINNHDTTVERDIKLDRDLFVGVPRADSQGVRGKIVGLRS